MQYGALSCYVQVVALWFQPTLLCLKLVTAAAYVATLPALRHLATVPAAFPHGAFVQPVHPFPAEL